MNDKETLDLNNTTVVLDRSLLHFDEDTLGEYLKTEGSYYDYIGSSLAKAERLLRYCEVEAEKIFDQCFVEYRTSSKQAVALCEAEARKDSSYQKANEAVVEAKYLVSRLKNHLRAWDKNHDNAQSLGHTLRKQLDKTSSEVTPPDEEEDFAKTFSKKYLETND